MTKLVETTVNGIVWLGVRTNGVTHWIKPIARAGDCRRPGSNTI